VIIEPYLYFEVDNKPYKIAKDAYRNEEIFAMGTIEYDNEPDELEAVERDGNSLGARAELALIAWNTAVDHPFGVGLNNFALVGGVYAHSNYLEILADTGFLGLLIYYGIYLLVIVKAGKLWLRYKYSSMPKALVLSILALAVMDIANVSYYEKSTWIFLVIVIATTETLRRQIASSLSQNKKHRRRRRRKVVDRRSRAATGST